MTSSVSLVAQTMTDGKLSLALPARARSEIVWWRQILFTCTWAVRLPLEKVYD